MRPRPLLYAVAAAALLLLLSPTAAPAAAAPPCTTTAGSYTPPTPTPTPLPALQAPSQGLPPEHSVSGPRGAVATEVDVCSNVGADVLLAGGNAADAAIAATLCVGSIDAFHSGIGGGGFILVRSPSGSVEMIDMRESMPAAGNETMYSSNADKTASTVGGLAVGVPGELRGWEALHARHGRLAWAELFAPAVRLNREGFRVPSQLAGAIASYAGLMCGSEYWAEVYCANGTAAGLGDTVRNARLADALEALASGGADAFYSGPMAERTVETVRANGGILTLEDLAAYKVVIREPRSIVVQGGKKRVWSTVAPSSGSVVLSALLTMDQFTEEETAAADFNLTTHRMIEAVKFAYGERTNYGDPAFVSNVTSLQDQYLTIAAAKEKRAKISDTTTFPPSYYDPANLDVLSDAGTSHIAVIDSDGMAVTLTTTVNLFWGSQLKTPDGFVLNDEMDDFSSPGSVNAFGYPAAPANFIRPGKRPLSSISPVIVEDVATGRVEFAIGSAGGSRIITANFQNAWRVLGGMGIQEALAAPRWHDQLSPARTQLEWAASSPAIPGWRGFSNATAAYLSRLGHNVTFVAPGSSSAQGVQVLLGNGTIVGGTEVRQLAARAAAV
ncbi:gamma-glutamyltranspeptidase [Zopfochytrium polystomum]|nr:gamma-glutamyltranspeptidase [Zopfochytrium polystomum]